MNQPEIVGLLPAAGRARRLGHLDGSKEALPLGPEARPVCSYLLSQLAGAGVERAVIVVRPGKEDIRARLTGGPWRGPRLEFRTIEPTASVPETLCRGLEGLEERRIALGFPDMLLRPTDAFARLRERQEETGADLALGLFRTRQAHRADMVRFDEHGRFVGLEIKNPDTRLDYTWSIALWTPRFSAYLTDAVAAGTAIPGGRELQVGDLVARALDKGLSIETESFPDSEALDIGTPDGLERARRELARFSTL